MTCTQCQDRGVLFSTTAEGLQTTRRCACKLREDIVSNIEQRWPNLLRSAKVPNTVLKGYLSENTWITSHNTLFMSHFRHIALRKGADFDFKVCTDANLMSAWLASAIVQGMKVLDSEAEVPESVQDMTLLDLADQSPFMIILLGVKRARNVAMPEVLLEALQIRDHKSKVTWVVDQPDMPLNESHLCYSASVMLHLQNWRRLKLTEASVPYQEISLVPAKFVQPRQLQQQPTRIVESSSTSLESLEEMLLKPKKPFRRK